MNRYEKKRMTTEDKLQTALIRLMETKSFSDITVSELCRAADLNRTTFYAHYKSTADAVEALEARLIRQFHEKMETVCPVEEALAHPPFENRTLIAAALEYIRDHRPEYRLYHTYVFFHKNEHWQKLLDAVFAPWLLSIGETDMDKIAYKMHFYLGGIYSLIELWLLRDCADPIDEIAALIQECVQVLPFSEGEGEGGV